jgi:hypothetical protein
MKYACRILPGDTAIAEIEAKLNEASDHGWDCIGVVLRHPYLMFVFHGDFPSIGDWQIGLNFLGSFQ